MPHAAPGVSVESVHATAYRIPTDGPEADGSFAWDATTLIVAEAQAGGVTGLGYTYGSGVEASLIGGLVGASVRGISAMDPPAAWQAMQHGVRNIGRDGVAAGAVSAVDVALWDLKAKLFDVLPLARCCSAACEGRRVPIYGSGGFHFLHRSRNCSDATGRAGSQQ